MISIFYGKDTFSIHKEIEQQVLVSKSELSQFDEISLVNFVPQLLTQSFFDDRRTFVVISCLKKMTSNEVEIIKALENTLNTDVIFVEDDLPTKSKIATFIKEKGKIKEFAEQKNLDLVTFIKKTVTEEGGEIAPLAAERLAGYVGADLWQLTQEIKKLVLYKLKEEEKQIQTSDVDLLVKAGFEANIFALLDAIAAKNNKRAAELLNSFLEAGENEIYLLTMIARQFRNIAMAKFEEKITDTELAKKAGIHPFVAKKSKEQARNFEKSEILEKYKQLCWADLKLKSGYPPDQVLLRLIS